MKAHMKTLPFVLAVFANNVTAFAPVSTSKSSLKSMHLEATIGDDNIDAKKFLGSGAVAAALFLSSAIGGADVASASVDNNYDFSGSSTLVSARSGGRAGGRSSYRAPPPRSSTTTIRRTTVVQPSTVMVAPPPVVVSPFGGYGYGYGFPFGGVGLGLNALNAVGNEVRDYRQESEIQKGRAELEVAKQREAELAARIQQLEMNQRFQQPAPALQQQ